MTSRTRRALVTGAGGFVGRHLCRRLLDAGVDVYALTRPDSAPPAGVERVPVEPTDKASLTSAIARIKPDVIFHLAGTTRADEAERVNVAYASQLLDALDDLTSSSPLLLVGSAAEYGRLTRPDGVVSEADDCHPLNAYGRSKLTQTRLALSAAERGQSVVVARLFNPIGPGSPPTSAPGDFVRQVRALAPSGGTLTTGPLDAVRDFTGITATVGALIALAESPLARGRVVNVCSGHGVSMSELVARLIDLAPYPVTHRLDSARGGTSTLPIVVGDNALLRQCGITIEPPDLSEELRAMLVGEG